jgi:hypothetical protein
MKKKTNVQLFTQILLSWLGCHQSKSQDAILDIFNTKNLIFFWKFSKFFRYLFKNFSKSVIFKWPEMTTAWVYSFTTFSFVRRLDRHIKFHLDLWTIDNSFLALDEDVFFVREDVFFVREDVFFVREGSFNLIQIKLIYC